MSLTLDLSDIVSVQVVVSPLAAPYSNFGTLMLMGSSDVIDIYERYRQYSNIDQVLNDFSNVSPEYLAAVDFFDQSPRPSILYIGRWAQADTNGRMHGGSLTPTQELMSNWTSITTGSLKIAFDGSSATDITGLNFSATQNLNAVAAIIQTAIRAIGTGGFTLATCQWNAAEARFEFKSGTTGASSAVSFMTTPASGVSIITQLRGTLALGARTVAGIVAETALTGAQALANASSQWYALVAATAVPLSQEDHLAIASYILASSRSRIYGITFFGNTVDTANNDCIYVTDGTDFASLLKSTDNKRVFWQYSSTDPYAVTSLFGRMATVNFNANNTTITLMFKKEPNIIPERLTESQAALLKTKGGNVYVYYNNDVAIIQPGQMSNGYFIDEVHGLDWLQNAIQIDVFNLLYQSTTKIPQTDGGAHLIVNQINATLARSVNNGLVAPGVWNADGFGQLIRGDALTNGFYTYCPPMALQSQADRETRVCPPIQVAAKLAGAIHNVPIIVSVNR
jgi:hypothetical protein